MKKTLCLVAMLAIVASASAYIEIFTTTADAAYISDPTLLYDHTERNFLPMVTGTVPAGPTGPLAMSENTSADLLVWGRFVQEPLGVRIFGLHLGTDVNGNMSVADSVIYRHRKATAPWDRWDNDQPIYMHPGCQGVGVAAAVTSNGIQFVSAANGDVIFDSNGDGNLDTFLVGAVQASAGAAPGELYIGLGTLGIIMYDETGNNSLFPDVYVEGTLAQSGGAPPTQCQWGLAAYIPEPTSLLLIGLAGLFLRRR